MTDWSLAQPAPNFTQLATNAFMAGQQQGLQRRTQNALASNASTPENLPNALLGAGNMQAASQAQQFNANADAQTAQREQHAAQVASLQRIAGVREKIQGGDIQGAYQAAAGDPEAMKAVDAAAQHVQATSAKLAQIGSGLKQIQDPQQRQAVFDSMKPGLTQAGLDQKTLDSFQPSDQNIDAVIAQNTTLAQQFEMHKPVSVGRNGSIDPTTHEIFGQTPKAAPTNFTTGPDGNVTFVPGGPHDPAVIRREAMARKVSGGAPAGGGHASGTLSAPSADGPLAGMNDTQILAKMAAENRVDGNRVNSRTAPLLANMFRANPDLNLVNNAGIAAMARNAPMQQKAMMVDMLPTVVANVRDAGKKLNFSTIRPLGSIQATIMANTNNPDFVDYMNQRNDAVQTLSQAMRGAGATDLSTKLESEAAHVALSPDAFDGWYRGQMKALEARQKEYNGLKVTAGGSVQPHAAPAGPKVGDVQQGYKFNGGNPADPHSWSKAG